MTAKRLSDGTGAEEAAAIASIAKAAGTALCKTTIKGKENDRNYDYGKSENGASQCY